MDGGATVPQGLSRRTMFSKVSMRLPLTGRVGVTISATTWLAGQARGNAAVAGPNRFVSGSGDRERNGEGLRHTRRGATATRQDETKRELGLQACAALWGIRDKTHSHRALRVALRAREQRCKAEHVHGEG